AFQQGRKQAEWMVQRYHYLRAAVTRSYEVREEPANISLTQLFPRQSVYFDRYLDFKLEPIRGMKLHPDEEGRIHPGDLEIYKEEIFVSWKNREAGILYVVCTGRPFWNMILNWHSPAHTTGVRAYDDLLSQWQQAGYPKSMLPCMFFARESGCLDARCPFKHDARATKADRDVVLAYRRAECGRLTPVDVERYGPNAGDSVVISPSDDGFLVEQIRECIVRPPEPVCWNVECRALSQDPSLAQNLKTCSRCRVATYCSASCQKANWKSHKPDCHPFERIIEDDELW
ncbi:hypothetical protein K488DRAFT_32981, partial [Vararia minispora EC-137]